MGADRSSTAFGLSIPYFIFKGGLVDPRLRASNEHILIVRVPRAGGRPGYPSHPSEAARCASTGNRPAPYFFLNPFIQKLREWPRLLFTARIERYTCSLQARLFSLWGWGLIDLPLRASNEGSPRPRVARAQKIISLHPLLCSASKKGTWPLPIPSSAELIPRIALFDRPEHRFFEFLQRHVLRIADGC